ncbi:MAG: hypothetical protein J6Y94_00580 [Bacteriovoracaceae bacterium]|nr:hypothetical protein [Bacteriovoracaceae bacterium]
MATTIKKLELECEEDAPTARKEQVSAPEDLGIDFTTSTNISNRTNTSISGDTQVISQEEMNTAIENAPAAAPAPQPAPDADEAMEVKPMPYTSPGTQGQIPAPPPRRPGRYLAELRQAKLDKTIYKKRSLFSQLKKAASSSPAAMTPARPSAAARPALAPAPPENAPFEEAPQETAGTSLTTADQTFVETEVRVAVAQAQGELLAEVLSEAKLMAYQVDHILKKFKTTNPQLQQYIKKIHQLVQDFAKKDFIK